MRHLHLLYSVVEWTNLVLRNLAAAQARREKSVLRETGPRGAVAFAHFAPFLRPALIDGGVGAIFAPGGRLERVVRFGIKNDKIHHVEIIADPASLEALDLAVVDLPS
jgi:hypothetical protein